MFGDIERNGQAETESIKIVEAGTYQMTDSTTWSRHSQPSSNPHYLRRFHFQKAQQVRISMLSIEGE
jgi:hypothetical protein